MSVKKDVKKKEPPMFVMFKDRTNFELKWMIIDLLHKRIPDYLYSEISRHEKGRGSDGNQLKKLNRVDLLKIIYIILAPEINRIDTAFLEDLPMLINEEWPVPELAERVRWRLEYGIRAIRV